MNQKIIVLYGTGDNGKTLFLSHFNPNHFTINNIHGATVEFENYSIKFIETNNDQDIKYINYDICLHFISSEEYYNLLNLKNVFTVQNVRDVNEPKRFVDFRLNTSFSVESHNFLRKVLTT